MKQKWNNIFPLTDTCKGINPCAHRYVSIETYYSYLSTPEKTEMLIIKKKKTWKSVRMGLFEQWNEASRVNDRTRRQRTPGQQLLPQEDAQAASRARSSRGSGCRAADEMAARGPGRGACPSGPPPEKLQGPLIKRKWKLRSERTPRKAFTEVAKGNVSKAEPKHTSQKRIPWTQLFSNSRETVQSLAGQELAKTPTVFTAGNTVKF